MPSRDEEYLSDMVAQAWPDFLGRSRYLGGNMTATSVGNTIHVSVVEDPEDTLPGQDAFRRDFVLHVRELTTSFAA